jgi:hypothetical protein
VAATVYFLPPFAKDPRLVPEPADVPRGAAAIGHESSRISIADGPAPVTITLARDWAAEAIAALQEHDVKKLRRIDSEFAPFWCFRCEKRTAGPIGGPLRGTTKASSIASRARARRDTVRP